SVLRHRTIVLLMKLYHLSLLLLCMSSPAFGGHVLVFPGEYSHWLNARTIMDELVRRNHSVTVLVADASPSVSYNNSRDAAKFNFLVFKVATAHEYLLSLTHIQGLKYGVLYYVVTFGLKQCDAILKNQQLMATLRDAAFDAVLLDPMIMCGDLVADVLGLPLVISLRFSQGGVMERHCGHVPAPPSFVPPPPLPYSDLMTFTERLTSVMTYVSASAISELFWRWSLDHYYSQIKGRPSSACETLGKADIWLMRTFWDMEPPRPLMPNFKHVGGLHCKPAGPLPEDVEAFVQSSGEAGVIVVSFGSMVTDLPTERAEVMAAAFGRMRQKVGLIPTAQSFDLCSGHLEIQRSSSTNTVSEYQTHEMDPSERPAGYTHPCTSIFAGSFIPLMCSPSPNHDLNPNRT
uniref:UDP glucuronosyltransferase 2 family, polypeptide A4 n=1 Tax=Takifugu rubripes TaxID=31033 RepID=H2TJ78_TAKRU